MVNNKSVKHAKFYTNDERIIYLRGLFSSGADLDRKEALNLLWMWIKTGVFTKREMERLLAICESVCLEQERKGDDRVKPSLEGL